MPQPHITSFLVFKASFLYLRLAKYAISELLCSPKHRRIFMVTTNVDKQLCTQGWSWVICCCLACFGGGWFLGLLVLCVDTFWKFDHYCPTCTNKIGTYSPKASCRITTLLILIVFAVIALNVSLAWYFGRLIIIYLSHIIY